MNPRTLSSYGAPFNDAIPRSDPDTEQSAAEADRANLDTVQLTHTGTKAGVFFDTTATAAPVTYDAADVAHKSQWGSGSSTKPTITKTATGLYDIEYDASFEDELEETETLALRPHSIVGMTGDETDDFECVFISCAANAATVATYSPKGTLADVGDQSGNPIALSVWFG